MDECESVNVFHSVVFYAKKRWEKIIKFHLSMKKNQRKESIPSLVLFFNLFLIGDKLMHWFQPIGDLPSANITLITSQIPLSDLSK